MANSSGAYLKDDKALKIFSGELLSNDAVEVFLQAASNAIKLSLQQGFEKSTDPSGTKWAANPDWWERIKGHRKPNIGIPPGRNSGKYKSNSKHMKDSIEFHIDMNSKSSKFTYSSEARDRAIKTHYGTDKIKRRPHFAFATWGRHPSGKPDLKVVFDIFKDIIFLRMQELNFDV